MIKIEKEYNFTNQDIFIEDNKDMSITDLNKCFENLGCDKIKNIGEYYNKLSQSLNEKNIKNLLSQKNKSDYLLYLKKELNKKNLYTEYYSNILPIKELFFSKMEPLLLDNKIIEIPVYKSSQKTGRVSIVSGFNYLTQKKSDRKLLKPIDKNYTLFEIDFISCEPNFYASTNIKEKFENNSFYQKIIDKFNIDIPIKNFKNAFLALLYGAGNKTIQNFAKIDSNTIDNIKDYININLFKNNIIEEYEKNNMFLNYYKRPILDISNPVNYWIQSSVVDYCCLSFNQFLETYNYIKIHAYIHDAIIISCPNKYIEDIKNIKVLREKISNIALPVKISKI